MKGKTLRVWIVMFVAMLVYASASDGRAEPKAVFKPLDPCKYKSVPSIYDECEDREELGVNNSPSPDVSNDKSELEDMKEDRAIYKCYLSHIKQINTDHGSELIWNMCYEYPQAIDW